jgi:hypothetical protein
VRRKAKTTARQRPVKLPVRLDAKPTRPHSSKKGKRGYSRKRAKAELRRTLGEEGGTLSE